MCGINGIFNYSGVSLKDEQSLMDAMNRCIAHRGPDDSGTWNDAERKLFLGHQRLSIIDLSAQGHQPMISDPGNVIVFNGEIYNYNEIRSLAGNHKYKSTSDTEVMLNLYEKYGEQCLQFFNGMFAFALWDPKKEELFLAKDRAGKKPLYYTTQGGVFAFSSEIKSLLTLPWIRPELDEKAFYHFLTFNQLAPPMTMFKNIFKVHPGYKMIVGKNGIEKYEQYWEVDYTDLSNDSLESLAHKTLEALEKSVRYRMVSDVPVGAFLSGGVDSSALVALMSRQSTAPVKTYSIGFENQPDYDELEYARKISKQFKTEHYEKTVTAIEICDFVPKIVDIFDEPLADSTCIPLYFLSEKAREQGTIVVLTGDGSDEIFAGYRSYSRYLNSYSLYHTYSNLPSPVKKIIAAGYQLFDGTSPKSEMLNRAAHNQEFFWGAARSFKESIKRNFLSESFLLRSSGWNSYEVIAAYRKMFEAIPKENKEDIDWMCYLGFKMNDTNRYLYRSDKLGMAHSIETRAPFMDYELVNFALSIPGKYKMMNGEPKFILKKSLESLLPRDILYRKKMGFSVPLREWAGGMMTDYVETNLHEFCSNTNLFNEEGLKRLVKYIRSGNKNSTNDLWTIYFLMAWFKKWMHA
ncbi:MAG: asparagine synthase (glutamine-hydrolyzing) [Bacteroidota bacterium]